MGTASANLRQRIKASKEPRVSVKVPEWDNATVWVRGVRVGEWEGGGDRFADLSFVDQVILFCETEDRKPLFTEEDREWLNRQPLVPLARVSRAAAQLNALSPSNIDDAEKN